MAEMVEVCDVNDLPSGSMKGLEYEGKRILVVNHNGQIHAMDGTCTHEEADLSIGFLMENRITCPLHLSQFDVTTGEALNPPATIPLKMFNVKIQGSRIYVQIP
ncbi:MAG: non-heme iron oxygenase ferredoxin subunit [Thaumarchaeota archaeon]|nr:non-heme iron oxygenase ferredoxin subunit [Nitrososphaerota archaeon]